MRLTIKVIPNAKQDKIIGEELDSLGNKLLKIKTCKQPEKNAANRAVIALLAEHFKIPKSNISIISGTTSRKKIVELNGL